MLKDVLSCWRFVAFHGIGQLPPFLLAEFEKQEMLTDGLFNKLNIIRVLRIVNPFDVLVDLIVNASSVDPLEYIFPLEALLNIQISETVCNFTYFGQLWFLATHLSFYNLEIEVIICN